MFNMLTLFITLAQNHFIVFVEKVKMTPKCPKNQNEQLRYKRKHQKEKKKKNLSNKHIERNRFQGITQSPTTKP